MSSGWNPFSETYIEVDGLAIDDSETVQIYLSAGDLTVARWACGVCELCLPAETASRGAGASLTSFKIEGSG